MRGTYHSTVHARQAIVLLRQKCHVKNVSHQPTGMTLSFERRTRCFPERQAACSRNSRLTNTSGRPADQRRARSLLVSRWPAFHSRDRRRSRTSPSAFPVIKKSKCGPSAWTSFFRWREPTDSTQKGTRSLQSGQKSWLLGSLWLANGQSVASSSASTTRPPFRSMFKILDSYFCVTIALY